MFINVNVNTNFLKPSVNTITSLKPSLNTITSLKPSLKIPLTLIFWSILLLDRELRHIQKHLSFNPLGWRLVGGAGLAGFLFRSFHRERREKITGEVGEYHLSISVFITEIITTLIILNTEAMDEN